MNNHLIQKIHKDTFKGIRIKYIILIVWNFLFRIKLLLEKRPNEHQAFGLCLQSNKRNTPRNFQRFKKINSYSIS